MFNFDGVKKNKTYKINIPNWGYLHVMPYAKKKKKMIIWTKMKF